jgi:hypothetical protein
VVKNVASGQCPPHPVGIDAPENDKTIGPDPLEQYAVISRTVHIRDVLGGFYTEGIEIQVGIPGHEWIKGPKNTVDASCEERLALIEFQLAADAGIPNSISDSQHVGPMKRGAVFESGEAKEQAEHYPLCIECSCGNSAYPLDDACLRTGDNLGEILSPCPPLEILECFIVLRGFQGTDDEVVSGDTGRTNIDGRNRFSLPE